MGRFFLIFFAFCFCMGFSPCKKVTGEPQLYGVQIEYSMEILDKDGLIQELKNSYSVFHYNGMEFFKFRYDYDSSYENVSNVTEKEAYLFFNKDSVNALQIDTVGNGFKEKKVPLAFYLKSIRVQFVLDKYLILKPDSSLFAKATGVLTEIYRFANVGSGGWTARLFFSDKFHEFNEPVSRALDSVKRKKLFKYEVINDPYYNEKLKIHFPRLKSFYEIKEVSSEDLQKANKALKAYLEITQKKEQ